MCVTTSQCRLDPWEYFKSIFQYNTHSPPQPKTGSVNRGHNKQGILSDWGDIWRLTRCVTRVCFCVFTIFLNDFLQMAIFSLAAFSPPHSWDMCVGAIRKVVLTQWKKSCATQYCGCLQHWCWVAPMAVATIKRSYPLYLCWEFGEFNLRRRLKTIKDLTVTILHHRNDLSWPGWSVSMPIRAYFKGVVVTKCDP